MPPTLSKKYSYATAARGRPWSWHAQLLPGSMAVAPGGPHVVPCAWPLLQAIIKPLSTLHPHAVPAPMCPDACAQRGCMEPPGSSDPAQPGQACSCGHACACACACASLGADHVLHAALHLLSHGAGLSSTPAWWVGGWVGVGGFRDRCLFVCLFVCMYECLHACMCIMRAGTLWGFTTN